MLTQSYLIPYVQMIYDVVVERQIVKKAICKLDFSNLHLVMDLHGWLQNVLKDDCLDLEVTLGDQEHFSNFPRRRMSL